MIKKFLLMLLFLGMASLIIVLGRVVLFEDYSTMKVSIESNPDMRGDIGQRTGVYLISYAHGPEIFFKNQNALAASTLNRGIDFIMNYRKSLLGKNFLHQNKEILDKKKGAGYWLWKPQIIAQTLKQIPEGSLLIYADTGLVLRQSITPYLKKMEGKDVMLVDYDRASGGAPIEIVKRDVFVRLQCDEPSCWEGNHVWAAFVVIRNTPKGRAFIEQWLELCQDPQLLEDGPSLAPAHARQRMHHHDEAILSVLYNSLTKQGIDYIHLLPVKDFRNLMAWHHRHPGVEYLSTLPKSAYFRMRGIERKLVINSLPFKKLRKWFQ